MGGYHGMDSDRQLEFSDFQPITLEGFRKFSNKLYFPPGMVGFMLLKGLFAENSIVSIMSGH